MNTPFRITPAQYVALRQLEESCLYRPPSLTVDADGTIRLAMDKVAFAEGLRELFGDTAVHLWMMKRPCTVDIIVDWELENALEGKDETE